MKTTSLAPLVLLLLVGSFAHAQKQSAPAVPASPPPPIPPPVNTVVIQTVAPVQPFVYEQSPIQGRGPLVTQEQAQTILSRFREGYPKLGSPRFLIYVNRELVDEESGLKLSARTAESVTQRTDGTKETQSVTNKNTYRVRENKEIPLADKQTARDLERLFGRPLRLGGASLADQRVGTQLLGDKAMDAFDTRTSSEQARKDREALSKIADVVIEILISSKTVTVADFGGDRNSVVPDIQATAIRLSDARIMGQATASDLMGHSGAAGVYFDVRQIAEATALSLMEDMLTP